MTKPLDLARAASMGQGEFTTNQVWEEGWNRTEELLWFEGLKRAMMRE